MVAFGPYKLCDSILIQENTILEDRKKGFGRKTVS